MEATPINLPQAGATSLSMMRREKRNVALNSVIAAVFITILKVIVGVTTGSLGIISEAAHSAFDLVAAIITLFSVRVSDKPADADPIAAIFVAGVILYVSSRLARQTIDALLDAAPPGARAKIMYELEGVEGVVDVERTRIRRAGNRYFADLTLGLHRNVTFQR